MRTRALALVTGAAAAICLGASATTGVAKAQDPEGVEGTVRLTYLDRAEALERGVRVAQDVLARERAFDERATRDGQWTAFRATASTDSLMFVPQAVNAQNWLAGRADPPVAVRWQPHGVFVSCDGLLATTHGFAQWPDGSLTRFRTIWQRQTSGDWKWVLVAGWPVATAPAAPTEPEIQIANCEQPSPPAPASANAGDARGASPDGSLRWLARVDGDGRGFLVLWGWNGRFIQQLSSDTMGPQQP